MARPEEDTDSPFDPPSLGPWMLLFGGVLAILVTVPVVWWLQAPSWLRDAALLSFVLRAQDPAFWGLMVVITGYFAALGWGLFRLQEELAWDPRVAESPVTEPYRERFVFGDVHPEDRVICADCGDVHAAMRIDCPVCGSREIEE